jgi:hypothetical protein
MKGVESHDQAPNLRPILIPGLAQAALAHVLLGESDQFIGNEWDP